MKEPVGTFPFGQPITVVEQQDREPRRIFVLGVYASAVHAQWKDAAGRTVVRALAVASEPYIFWRGEGAASRRTLGRMVSHTRGVGREARPHAFVSGRFQEGPDLLLLKLPSNWDTSTTRLDMTLQ
jgi:hypothetical protein